MLPTTFGLVCLLCFPFLLHSTLATANLEDNALFTLDEDECSMIVCRAGRECRVNMNGEAACRCVANCPDHFVPVCGSNNVSYDNFCLMHRDACLTGVHISLQKKGYCSNKPAKKKKTKSNKTETLATKEDALFEPVVCFQWERDALRRQIITHFHQHTTDQSWYRPGLKSIEKRFARFFTCDTSKDDYLDANELATCVADVPFAMRTTEANNELVKVLCVDAIIDSGDSNSDWRLDFDEYKALMDSSFQPKEKLCSLEGKKYEDGSQTKVDCNDCVCACGSWICSSKKCEKEATEFGDELSDDDFDEDLEDELNEPEDTEVRKSGKVEDIEDKIFKIEEDIFAKVDDPDEDQPAKISWKAVDLDDDELEGEDEDEELDDNIEEEEDDPEPVKKKSNKSKKHTH